MAHSARHPVPFGILKIRVGAAALQVERQHRYLISFTRESNTVSKRTFLLPECTTWPRRSGCAAVCLVAAGLFGCGAEDDWQHTPAHDDFRYAHVLHPDYVDAYAAPDTQETDSGNTPAEDGTYMLSRAVMASSSQNLSPGWAPQQFQTAYNVPGTRGDNKPAGYGAKVAVITAYHYSNLQNDLNKFAKKYSLKPITLNIINQAGTRSDSNWAMASCLAVQMINTVSPGAILYVIEAKSVSQIDIRTAMQTAVNLGINVVLMPFGADEAFSQNYEPVAGLSTGGVVWIAPSGDSSTPSFPATHPSVIAVGGTTAHLNTLNALHSETAWADAGAGMSMVAEMPSHQMIPSVQQRNTTAHRSVPDVAFNADPYYGAQVYTSILGGYFTVGGTAVSAAFFTGVVVNALASRKSKGMPMLTSSPGTGLLLQDSLYRLMSTNGGPTNSNVLNDVVDGFAGAGAYPAGPGYDIATGLGSLNVEKFIEYMDTQ